MDRDRLLSIYEFGGLDAESFCKFEDCGKARLDLIPFDPDHLPQRDARRPGELLLSHEPLNSLLSDAAPDPHSSQYRHLLLFW
jgi:hypothetical protein